MSRHSSTACHSPIIVALDVPHLEAALQLADDLDPGKCRVKVGKELYTREGPAVIKALHGRGFEIFLDLKFHDIPNTVAQACRVAVDLGVWMLNVHASGGARMLDAAREAVDQEDTEALLVAVTVLTSMTADDLVAVGVKDKPADQVLRLARMAQQAGLDGVVCSAQEATLLRTQLNQGFQLVTPGIRMPTDVADDQRRVMTPSEAIAAGVNYLVVGRPITQAAQPAEALELLWQSLPN